MAAEVVAASGGGGGGGRRSDIALKHDVVLLGHLANGLGYYRFSYLGSSKALCRRDRAGSAEPDAGSRDPRPATGISASITNSLGLKLRTYTRLACRRRKDPHASGGLAMTVLNSLHRAAS